MESRPFPKAGGLPAANYITSFFGRISPKGHNLQALLLDYG